MNTSIPPQKQCIKCLEFFPATTDYFYTRKNSKYGERDDCKTCRAAYKQAYDQTHKAEKHAYRQEHTEEYRAYEKAYRQAHKEQNRANQHTRRARKQGNGGTHTAADIQLQYKRQKGKCYYAACGHAKLGKVYHVDHVVPVTRNGSNSIDNLVLACPTCNLKKNNKLPHEWFEGGRLM